MKNLLMQDQSIKLILYAMQDSSIYDYCFLDSPHPISADRCSFALGVCCLLRYYICKVLGGYSTVSTDK